MINKKKPILTVYADSNLLIDILASIDNGFTLMEEIKTINRSEDSSNLQAELKAGFSIPSMFNLFKVGIDTGISSENNKKQSFENSQNRYHTLGSLLYKLVNSLEEKKLLNSLENPENFSEVKCGDIITTTGIINLNPLNNSLEKTVRLIKGTELLASFTDLDPKQNKNETKKQLQPMLQIGKKLNQLLDDVTPRGQKALILENDKLNFSILFSIYDNFTRDLAGLEFGNHTFTVLGKVIGISENGADLLERSSLSGFNKEIFTALSEAFGTLGESYNIPEFKINVEGKVLTIIPIAIYT